MNKSKKITIGIVCTPWLGGSGVVGSELAKYLTMSAKYNVVYIGVDNPFRFKAGEVTFYRINPIDHAMFAAPLNEGALVEGIVEAVLAHKIDIIHAHFAVPYAYCALQAREILKQMKVELKVVTTLHGTDVLTLGKKAPAIMKYILKQSDAVTAVSKDLARRAKNIYSYRGNISVIYNFVDFNIPMDQTLSKKQKDLLISKNGLVFVHISNFRPIKRVNDCLKVFQKVNKKIPSVLLFIGEGPELNGIKRKVESKIYRDSVHFIPSVSTPYEYLKIADGLIITSEYESFCLVGLEAAANGVPVFGTKVGGIPEVIKHGVSGYLSELGDIEGMANNIINHFKDDSKVLRFKNKAYEESHRFAADKIIPDYEAIYQNLMTVQKDKPLKVQTISR